MPSLIELPIRLQRATGPACEDLLVETHGQRTIGRGSDSDISLDNDSVSRLHAQLCWSADSVATIVDLGSKHGTLLNGAFLEPKEPFPLHNRDLVTIGPWTFVVRLAGEPEETHVAPPLASDAPVAETPAPEASAKPPDPYRTRASVLLRLRANGTLDREVGWNDFSRIYGPVIAGFARNSGVPPQEIECDGFEIATKPTSRRVVNEIL